jgi:hypothetical protein
MSNKKLLSESEVRRFMALANIPSLNESSHVVFDKERREKTTPKDRQMDESFPVPMGEEEELELGDELGGDEMDAGGMEADPMGGDEMGGEPEMGAAAGGDMQEAFRKAVEALAQAFGVNASVEGGEGGADHAEPDADQMGGPSDMDADNAGEEDGEGEEEGDEEGEEDGEELDEAEEKDEKDDLDEAEEKEEKDELDEAEGLDEDEVSESRMSTDELVETVLRRVTARLISEKKEADKKAGKKKSAKDKMAAMRAKKKGAPAAKKGEEKKKKPMKEANASAPKAGQSNGAKNGLKAAAKPGDGGWEGAGQGDQKWAEGTKNSKGGHAMKPLPVKGGHTITHKKTSSLPSKGGNKTK